MSYWYLVPWLFNNYMEGNNTMAKKNTKRQIDEKSFYGQYKANHFINERILDESFLDDLSAKLLYFAYTSDGSIGFYKYVYSLGIPWTTFNGWLKKYPCLKDDYEQAKLMLGENLQANALMRKFDVGLAKFILFNLLPEYKEIQQFLASLKDLDTEEAKTKIVLIENIGQALEKLEAVHHKWEFHEAC